MKVKIIIETLVTTYKLFREKAESLGLDKDSFSDYMWLLEKYLESPQSKQK